MEEKYVTILWKLQAELIPESYISICQIPENCVCIGLGIIYGPSIITGEYPCGQCKSANT